MEEAINTRKVNIWLGLIIVISVILRLGMALYMGDKVVELPGIADQISYHSLAVRLLEGHGFTFDKAWWPVTQANEPTAHWSYLYTFFLVAVYKLFGIHPLAARIIQAMIVGVLGPLLAFHLAKNVRWRKSRQDSGRPLTIGLFAAAVTAVYVYFIYYAAALMTESFFIIAVMATLFSAIKLVDPAGAQQDHPVRFTVLFGFSLLSAALLRQLILLFVPFLFLWMILAANRRHLGHRILPALGAAIFIMIVGILPITLFNYQQFNRFVLINTNAGYALFWGNHPVHGTRFIPAGEMEDSYQRLVPDELRNLNEAALDQALLKEGVRFILEEPGRYARLSLSRIPEYFRFWPDSRSSMLSNFSRLSSFALFLPFILIGLCLPFFDNGSPLKNKLKLTRPSYSVLLLYLFIVVYTGIHILTWALVRYRLVVDSVFLLFAALAIETISRRIGQRAGYFLPGWESQPQINSYD